MARDFAEGLRFVDGARLTAIGSRSRAKAESFARLLGIRQSHGRYEELVLDPSVDVVYVATPANEHRNNCLLALQAGKAVLCEKPFTVDAREADDVIAYVRQQKLFCMEAMWMHFIPGIRTALELIRAGAIGEVRMLNADFGYPTRYEPESRAFNPALGGGAMLDLGVYPLALAWRLFGKPDQVSATSTFCPSGVDEHSSVILRYPAGQIAMLSATLSGYASNEAIIVGTEGRITIHEPFCRPDRLTIKSAPMLSYNAPLAATGLRHRLRTSRLARGLRRFLPSGGKTMHVSYVGNGFNYEAAEVVRCMTNGEIESPVWLLDQTKGVMETIDLVRSASHG